MITGISRHLASRLALRLEADPQVEEIVGVDTDEPEMDLERTRFVRADIRNPLIVKTIRNAEVDTLVHLSLIATPTRVGGRGTMKEINVIGSMQLFAAAQKAPLLRSVVVKSTTAVYGASPQDPAFFTEDVRANEVPKHGYAKDAVEVARAARDFGRRRPDVALTILQFLIYGRVVDNDRLKREFGYTPVHSSRSALEEFAAGTRGPRVLTPQRADQLAGELYAFLTGGRRVEPRTA